MRVYPSSNLGTISSPSHPVFKYVENRFWNWLDSAPHEKKDMYFSEDAVYDKKGAIQSAIEAAYEEACDEKKVVNLIDFDIEANFE